MAKIVSTFFSSMRGSIAGTTYLTTSAGQIIARQRTRPVNAPSVFRTWIKNAMTQSVSDWENLLTSKRNEWQTWALANGAKSGRQEFTAGRALGAFITNGGLSGVVTILNQPFRPDFVGHPSHTLTATPYTLPASTGVAFKIRNTSVYSCIALLQLSAGLSQARNYWKGPWDDVQTVAIQVAAGVSVTQQFVTIGVGERFFCRCRTMSMDNTVGKTGCVVSSPSITFSVSVTNI